LPPITVRRCRPLSKSARRSSAGNKTSVRRCRARREALRGKPPAGAGNFLRRKLDKLFEPQQLPVVRMTGEGKTGFAGKRNHRLVGAQGIAEQARRAESCSAALQIAQQRRTDTLALPAVIDR